MTDELRGGVWNMRRDREPISAVDRVVTFINGHGLDFLLLCETDDYVRHLRLMPHRYGLVVFDGKPGQSGQAIVTRPGLTPTRPRIVRVTRRGWFTIRGHRTAPKWMPVCELAAWLTVAAIHTAPSVRWRRGRWIPVGPIRRVRSRIAHARSVRRFTHRNRGPLVIGGDFNATPREDGRWSPAWIARKTRLRRYMPSAPTHGRRTIDYVLAGGVRVRDMAVHGRGGSDHRLVTFTVRKAR